MKSRLLNLGASPGDVSFNMVPMVDVAFLLILFFILTSQIAYSSWAAMELANPRGSQALRGDNPNRVIVNVVCKYNPHQEAPNPMLAAQAREYQIDGNAIALDDEGALVRELERRRSEAKAAGLDENAFSVEVRADRRVGFLYVKPVITAATRAGVPKLSITALAGGAQ